MDGKITNRQNSRLKSDKGNQESQSLSFFLLSIVLQVECEVIQSRPRLNWRREGHLQKWVWERTINNSFRHCLLILPFLCQKKPLLQKRVLKMSDESNIKGLHKELFEKSLKNRREVVGDAYVNKALENGSSEFAFPRQELVTE
jgi:hypothetical protein